MQHCYMKESVMSPDAHCESCSMLVTVQLSVLLLNFRFDPKRCFDIINHIFEP